MKYRSFTVLCLLVASLTALPPAAASAQPSADPPATEQQAPPPEPPAVQPPAAEPPAEPKAPVNRTSMESICLMIEAAALANGLPLDFFARVIWQESRFRPDAIGPVTRSGDQAQGIAQFMPRTAAERQLFDPFDPIQALPKSAEFLAELRGQFGNLGLAAAAYNSGPQRVRDWLAGRRTLPGETRRYVLAITGRTAEEWAAPGAEDPKQHPGPVAPNCNSVTAMLRTGPNPFIQELERRVTAVASAPWGVQLSAGFSRDRVLASYAAIERRFRDLLAERDPTIFRLKFRSRGTRDFYQMRVGTGTREAANTLCASLRKAGGACMVLRNAGPALRPL